MSSFSNKPYLLSTEISLEVSRESKHVTIYHNYVLLFTFIHIAVINLINTRVELVEKILPSYSCCK